MVRCGHCIGYRREKFRFQHTHTRSSSALSLKGNREPWKVIGSDLFLKVLFLLNKDGSEGKPGWRGVQLDKGTVKKGWEEEMDRWGEGARLSWMCGRGRRVLRGLALRWGGTGQV